MIDRFAHSLSVQLRVIGALLRREMLTRYGRSNIGFLWLFAEPMLFLSMIMVVWGVRRSGMSIPVAAFTITGYPVAMLWRNAVSRGKNAISPNNSLLYHKNVKVLDIFTARIILELSGVIASFFFLVITLTFFGLTSLPENPLKVIFGLFLTAWFGFAFAMVIGALSERSEIVSRIWKPISFVLFISSGVFTLVDWLPPLAQSYVLWLPMVHGVELVRDGYFGRLFTAHYDIGYLVASCLVFTLCGLALVKQAANRVELT